MVFIYYINSNVRSKNQLTVLENISKTYNNVIYMNNRILYDFNTKKEIKENDFSKKIEYILESYNEYININIIKFKLEEILTLYYIFLNLNKKFKFIINNFSNKTENEYVNKFDNIITINNLIKLKINNINHILKTSSLKIKNPQNFYFNIKNQHNDNYGFHRYGWEYVKKSLIDIENPNGILLDLFLEKTFIWEKDKNIIYKEPWVGFIHIPFNVPQYLIDIYQIPNILELDNFKESLKFCKGLIVLSEESKLILSSKVDVSVYCIKHPVPFGIQTFDFKKYNSNPQVVHIGYWLRNYSYFLNLKTVQKRILLEKKNKEYWLEESIQQQKDIQMNNEDYSNKIEDIETKTFLENEEYDDILTSSIVFINLEDTTANNVIVECIQYSTPILVNKHPAVIEYLGEEYPFYYETQEEANKKIDDVELILETHSYLINLDKDNIYINNFIRKLCNINLNIINYTIGNQYNENYGNHRSGWKYVLSKINDNCNKSLIQKNNNIYLDTFLESTFVWGKNNKINKYTKPWCMIQHNPPNIPKWFKYEQSFKSITQNDNFIRSVPFLKKIITLSDYNAKYLRNHRLVKTYNIPVHVLYHPTDIPEVKFTMENFNNNNEKKVIQVGWWLRKLHSIFLLPKVEEYTKIALGLKENFIKKLFLKENKNEYNNSINIFKQDVELYDRVSDQEYDKLLSENIIFVELYDASANNLVIECIARNTPILINPVGGVVDYLGYDYPFYYSNLIEASEKLKNKDLINKTTEYLRTNKDVNDKININNFINNLNNLFNY